MAKKTSKKRKASKKVGAKTAGRRRSNFNQNVDATDKQLVIVESPTKAKTINKYLGSDYVVMASVGHVRDLPARNPKGVKQPVPGVDVEHDFQPTYEIMPDKKDTVGALKKAAKSAAGVWFATDLDREGEAIAWHLANALKVDIKNTRRVVFNAITKAEIDHAFQSPRPIDEARVNAQQARRILDRIVGYQVSNLLWKKVARNLSAGRVQSVGVRLCVEREREIEAFVPDEFWKIAGIFAIDIDQTDQLAQAWRKWLDEAPDDSPRSQKDRIAWLSERRCLQAELIEVAGAAFKAGDRDAALGAARKLGFSLDHENTWEDKKAKGPATNRIIYRGSLADAQARPDFQIKSIQTKRTSSRPPGPFITSTLQQAAANQLGFALQRTMRVAQQLYEGIDIKGAEGQVGLITYMRTDSTHISREAMDMVRGHIKSQYGDAYLPDKPNFFSSSNKAAQEAHEAIRPTDVSITPQRVQGSLSEEQFKLYRLIWQRFVACQMTPAQWDATTVLIEATGGSEDVSAVFKTTGRKLVFDGFYKVTGVPTSSGDLILPELTENQPVGPMQIDPTQHFTNPPPRYTEASLQKKLEEEGIGRPSTYAAIIDTIQKRDYVKQLGPKDRRLYATDLGKVVTDKLVSAFPGIMDVAYTRGMESRLDKIEDEHLDWVKMLHEFYGPFKEKLERAHEEMEHAGAPQPAPFKCPKCGAPTVYRFAKTGRFITCSKDREECDYRAAVDREGKPVSDVYTDVRCPICGGRTTKRTGRFGPFLGCENYPNCSGIVNLDPKKGTIKLPKTPPMTTELPCPKCDSPLYLRSSKRGPWLSCSTFPKCRGRQAWSAIEPEKQKELEVALKNHEQENPQPAIKNDDGDTLGEDYVPKTVHEENVAEELDPAQAAVGITP